tara:strand:+ start:1287 stop:1613 length:327 start_codon:yes stop_codon:yes gene_type:complete
VFSLRNFACKIFLKHYTDETIFKLKRTNIMSDTIDSRVMQIVSEQLGVNAQDVTVTSSFVDDLGADSLDTVELVMALEEEFNVEIPDEEAEKITTIQQAVDFINSAAE